MTSVNSDLTNTLEPWSSFLTDRQKKEVQKAETCSICLNIHKKPILTNCQHIFCYSCYNSALSDHCPECSKEITHVDFLPTTMIKFAIVTKVLGLDRLKSAPTALKTPEQLSQYQTCRSHIQNHIMNSNHFSGPWCCEMPYENLHTSVILRLRYQLEIRGFSLYNLFKDEDKVYFGICKTTEQAILRSFEWLYWHPEFTAEKVLNKGKEKFISQLSNIQHGNLSDAEKQEHSLQILEKIG